MTPDDIKAHPDGITQTLKLAAGTPVILRALRPDDAELLGWFFVHLLPATTGRFAPHSFTVEQAQELCSEIDYGHTIRLVGVLDRVEGPEIIAYFILILGLNPGDQKRYEERGLPLAPSLDCGVAPCVADAYQDCGLGSMVMEKVLDLGRQLGRQRAVLLGGVLASNLRAVHFYDKFGFRKVGTFSTGVDNFDMILDLG